MPDQPYIAAVRLPASKKPQMMAFSSKTGRAAFIAAVKALEPNAEAITSEIPDTES